LKNEKERLIKEVDIKASQLTELESRAMKMEAELRSFPVKQNKTLLNQLQIIFLTFYVFDF